MSVLALKRPPNDSFTFRLFFKLSNQIPDADKVYIWSIVMESNYRQMWKDSDDSWYEECEMDFRKSLIKNISKPTVILGVKDHLTNKDFEFWKDYKPSGVKYLEDMITFYQDKKFILFTSLENLDLYLNLPNLTIIPWGGDITNQETEYKKLNPVLEKNFDSPYTYVSLNRNRRNHRIVALSKLFGLDLEQHGLISCMFRDKLTTFPYWPIDPNDVVYKGFEKLKKHSFNINDPENIYNDSPNSNAENFESKLKKYYTDTFVEIISETSFTEDCFLLTEKTLNSFYGCNFPILLCSAGSVELLRNIGFDMFDDIIDHSYDKIKNPIDRIHSAIYNNQDLLRGLGKDLWSKNIDRFLFNVDIAKNKMHDYYLKRAHKEFDKILNENIQR